MTVEQFKAWFEGFSEGVDGAPTKEQFDRIRQKVAELKGTNYTGIRGVTPLSTGEIVKLPLAPTGRRPVVAAEWWE